MTGEFGQTLLDGYMPQWSRSAVAPVTAVEEFASEQWSCRAVRVVVRSWVERSFSMEFSRCIVAGQSRCEG